MTGNDRALDVLLLEAEVARFFSVEAELLDERRFEEWLELLHPDIRYWMPMARNVRFDRPESNIRVPGTKRTGSMRARTIW